MDNFFENMQNMDPMLLQHIINSIVLNDNFHNSESNSDNDNDDNNSDDSNSDNDSDENDSDDSNSENDSNDNGNDNGNSNDNDSGVNDIKMDSIHQNIGKFSYGCEHYLRRCKIVSPCCNEIYSCRLCHDENKYELVYDDKIKHKIDRFKISEVICSTCNKKQNIKQYCEDCNTCFGLYYCDICHVFDDIDKNQFHCDECGFCRIGGKENFVHCDKCSLCVSKNVYDTHKCLNIIDSLCAVCMCDMFTSTIGIIQLKCGHYMHNKCLSELLNVSYKCPMCLTSIIKTTELNKIIDDEINETEMPDEYKNVMVHIFCNDCHKDSTTKFHIVGLKCQHCNGYNTRKS